MSDDKNFLRGEWHYIETEAELEELVQGVRVKIYHFTGPGKYLRLSYQEQCPRGCCYDDVREMMDAADVIAHCKDVMQDYASILSKARKKEVENHLLVKREKRLAEKREREEKYRQEQQEKARQKEEQDRKLFEEFKTRFEGGK